MFGQPGYPGQPGGGYPGQPGGGYPGQPGGGYPGQPGGGFPGQPPTHPGMFSGHPQVTLSWVPVQNGQVPQNAVSAGNGVFVARGAMNGELIPGKAARGHKSAYLPYGGKENAINQYEVLCDTHMNCFGCNYEWQRCNGFNIPHGALIGGHTNDRQPLYIARGVVNGEAVAGKVHEANRCAYFPHGGVEHTVNDFEILVVRQ